MTKISKPVYMFKWIHENGKPHFGDSDFKYSLPIKKGCIHSKGKQMPTIKDPEMCYNGYHASYLNGIFQYATGHYGNKLFLVEMTGTFSYRTDKAVSSDIRIIREVEGVDVEAMEIIHDTHQSKAKYINEVILEKNPWLKQYNYATACKASVIRFSIDNEALKDIRHAYEKW